MKTVMCQCVEVAENVNAGYMTKTAYHRRFTDHHTHHHDVSVDVIKTVDYVTDRFP